MGTNILNRLFTSDAIDFMRLAVAEAPRFPNLANIGRVARERGAQAVTHVLAGTAKAADIDTYAAFAPASLETTVQFFLDLVIARPLLRVSSDTYGSSVIFDAGVYTVNLRLSATVKSCSIITRHIETPIEKCGEAFEPPRTEASFSL